MSDAVSQSDVGLARFAAELPELTTKSLFQAGLAMTLFAVPELTFADYDEKLDALSAEVAQLGLDPVATIQALFAETRLRGNHDDYYDPRNSYLSEVLDRRLGIPITLAIVAISVGARLGIDVSGVPFPGHFMVRLRADGGSTIVDPFAAGAVVSDPDLLLRMRAVTGRLAAMGPAVLGPAKPRDILVRVLTNLKMIYLKGQDHDSVLAVQERLVLLLPHNLAERRDRGLMYARAGRDIEAEADLHVYLEHAGNVQDAVAVRRIAEQVRRNRGPVN